MKLLITSVGSMVGKNILDVLDFPGLSRRGTVRVVGTNTEADSPFNFLCDRCYLVPQTAAEDYVPRMREILAEERPDLVLCGRDVDTLVLSRMRERDRDFPYALPVGTPQSAILGLDKWETWRFSQRHGLPCAETLLARDAGNVTELSAFCSRAGFPLVAKPVQGYASRGVYFLRDDKDLKLFCGREEYLLQEYLGTPETLAPYFAQLAGPPPLSAHAPGDGHYSCQTIIGPGGDLTPPFVNYLPHDGTSVAREITIVRDSELEGLTAAFGRALAAEGARGPVNAAFRRDRHGAWKLQELNLRNTGATFARFLLGMDELYLIAQAFVPHVPFPEKRVRERDRAGRVGRYDATYLVPQREIDALKHSGTWTRGEES